jgi:O-antigen/teichoic acid export membrane protein
MTMPSNEHVGRFLKHSSIYLVGNIVNRIGAFLLLPVYTNYLSVPEYGALELFYAVMTVISGVLSIGLAHATLRFYFEYKEISERNALVSTNMIASLVISFIGVAMVVPWAPALSGMIFDDATYTRGIYLILATIVFELSSQVSLAYLRAIERSMLFVGIALAKLVVQVGLNIYLLVVEQAGVNGVLFGNLITVIAGWAVLTAFTIRHCGLKFDREKAVPVLRYSYPFLLSTLVGIVSANADRFIIGSILSLQALGLYALAMKFSQLLRELIGEPFNRAYGAFRFSIMDDPDAGAIQAQVVRYLLVISVTAALGLSYFTHDLLQLISAPEYWPAAQIMPVLLLASVIRIAVYPMQTGILYHKQPRQIFYINIAVAIVSVVGNFVLIRFAGLWGACAAFLATGLVEMVLTNHIAQRYLRVTYEYRQWSILAAITLGFFLLGIAATAATPILGLIIKACLLIAFVAAVLASPVFVKSEIMALKSMRQRQQPGLPADQGSST